MKRKIYNKLLDWKQRWQGRTALLVDGARRIGKSWIVEEFGRNEYKSCVVIDFNNPHPEVLKLFEQGLSDIESFFMHLSLYTNVKLYKRDTLIVFDEVQVCPKARAAIKYLVKDGRYDYIETGSLVGINANVKDIVIPSEEIHIEMFPMDLEEFMWALGQDMMFDYVKECFAQKKPIGQDLHRKMTGFLREYLLVGGMPQAVESYVQNRDMREVDEIKRSIIALYRNDILKYAGRSIATVTRIFDNIPGMLQQHEKKFRPAMIRKGTGIRDFREPMFWLDESRIVNFCYAATEPSVGLALNRDDAKVKLYMADTGLLISMSFSARALEQGGYEKILKGKLEYNEGMIIENYVAQQLRSYGHPLYFFSQYSAESENRMEIDFLISKEGITSRHNVIPIEVKSSTRYSLVSLNKFRNKFSSYLSTAVVFHPNDFEEHDGVVYLPLYMAGL